MVNSNRPNIRASIESAQAQPTSKPHGSSTGLLRLAIFCSYPAAGILVLYGVFRWLFLGGVFSNGNYWQMLQLADYTLAIVLSFSAALWLAFLLLKLRQRSSNRPAASTDES